MNKSIFSEGSAKFVAPKADTVSKEMRVFYNPAMKLNRDITVAVLSACELSKIYACDLMAATGVRTIRLAKELLSGKIARIYANDMSSDAAKLLKANLRLNNISFKEWKQSLEGRKKSRALQVIVSQMDANLFLNKSLGFSYIDIDPFGSPNPFLDNAIKRISRNGILAITATDTAPLSGTFENTCLRNYWARPCRNAFMHESGLRILIRKAQLIGAQYGRALIPIFSYYHQHYFRVFFRCEKSKEKADEIISKHGFILYCRKCLHAETAKEIFNRRKCSCGTNFEFAGPLWLGSLWDAKLLYKILKTLGQKSEQTEKNRQLIDVINACCSESKIKTPWFYDIGELCERNKIGAPKKKLLISSLKKRRYSASETHFDGEGIRTDAPLRKIVEVMKTLSK